MNGLVLITLVWLFGLRSALVLVLLLVTALLSISTYELDKPLPIESGFVTVRSTAGNFSLHFFMLMVLFVLFDLEILLLLGLIVVDFNATSLFILVLFLAFVVGSVVME